LDHATAPDAGLQQEAPSHTARTEYDFLASIAAARQEAQTLFELSNDLGKSLSLDETLSVLSSRLRRIVPYNSIAFWIRQEDVLVAKHVNGDDFHLFSSLQIPLGSGLSGWVVQNLKPIINGNPAVESAYLQDPAQCSTLHSALSVPLEGMAGCVGALTLYRAEAASFSKDELRVLLAISSKAAMSVENALKYQQAQSLTTADPLTGLPNARSLFLYLDGELARCKRTNSSAVVLVCDLNGFKTVNDEHGHLQGDKVLRAFAEGLRESFREYDYVARMGGDEFVIVAPGLQRGAVDEMTERLSAIAAQAALRACPGASLSASVGHAFYSEDGTDAEQLLNVADHRMYSCKQRHYIRDVCVPNPPALSTSHPHATS
jgi:diguanylate cyclase (GGDEF)-like protein